MSRFRDVTKLCLSRETEHKKALDSIECFFAFLKGDAEKGDPGMVYFDKLSTGLSSPTLGRGDTITDSRLEAFALLWSAMPGDLPMSTSKLAAAVKS